MPPRIHITCPKRASALSSGQWTSFSKSTPLCLRLAPHRGITADEKPLPTADKPGKGPNQDQLPHISEETAAINKIIGETPPDIEQGTPIQEVLERDKDGQKKAPEVLKDALKSSTPKGARSYTTSARKQQEAMISFEDTGIETQGHIFGLPELPIQSQSNLKHRYDPVVHQVTNLLMRDGKLSKAQRNMAVILNHLRTTPPPTVNPNRPLLPGAPPASHLPLNPILYLTLAIDSVAPLLRIRSQKGAAGGGVALQIPIPMGVRQRRRQAVQWILDVASKRKTRGSGRDMFALKVAEELISVVEGKSSVWERRTSVHKLGIQARSNLNPRKKRF
ncbi:MAG: hypothetical protein MMC33_006742 [Icmadophila ericetorum]|nr:hypothetical protein [Icmadophila ericetorum]